MQKKSGVHLGTTLYTYLCAIQIINIYNYAKHQRLAIASTDYRPLLR